MRTTTLFFLGALIVAAPAFAVPATHSAAPASNAPSAVEIADSSVPTRHVAPAPTTAAPVNKKICKRLPSSYSRMTVRTCLTADEWRQVDEQAR